MVIPVALCAWWAVVTLGAGTDREAKRLFMDSCPVFAYYDAVWIVSAVLSAVAFFFSTRLARCKTRAVRGVFILVMSAVALALSIGHFLVK